MRGTQFTELSAFVAVADARRLLDETFGGREWRARRGRVKHVNNNMSQIGDHIGRTGVISGERACQSTKP